jgi:hypothetical protein
MKKIYQVIRLLKLQILLDISNHASVKTPGFPIFLALIMLSLVMPFLVPQERRILPSTLFESIQDSFKVQVTEGWVIHDVNNTGSMLIQESRQGYAILAQLCPEEEGGEEERQQQQGALTDVSSNGSYSCQQQQQQAQQEIIHIIRYPNLGPRLGIALDDIVDVIPDSVLNYQIQKLQEVGYRDINIVNSADTKIIVYNPASSGLLATAPARFVEITYSTDSAPSEMRTGYLFLTASNATPPNEMITGYSIFYDGTLAATAVRAEETTQSGSLLRASPAAAQILDSFGLIPSEAVAQFISDAKQAAVSNQIYDAGEEPSQPTSATRRLDASRGTSIIVYSLLVIGVVWKFVSYMREKRSTRLNEIS